MTDMRIASVALPDELDKAILNFKKQDDYIRLSYSEVIRRLLYMALDMPVPNAKDGKEARS